MDETRANFLLQPQLDNLKVQLTIRSNGQIVRLHSLSPQYNTNLLSVRSVPTHDDIAVPETLLKKQKQQEKVTQGRAADLKQKREVR